MAAGQSCMTMCVSRCFLPMFIPVSLHSRWWVLLLWPGERERENEQQQQKKSPHGHKATCTQITQATGTGQQKWTAKASFNQPPYSSSFMLKKKRGKKEEKKREKRKGLASVTNSIPTGKTQVSRLLDYMFEHMLGAAWSNLNCNRVARNIILFGELEL